MSNKVSNLVYSRKVGSAHRKAVLAYMADKASDGGEGVFCSKGTIADETEVARSTVFKVIKCLVDEGILIEAGKRACTNGHTVIYHMDLNVIAAFPLSDPEAEKARDQSASETGPQRDQSAQRTRPVRSTDPDQSASRTQTTLRTILEQEEPPLGPPADLPVSPIRPDVAPDKPPPKARLPEDWALSDEGWAYARSQAIPDQVIEDEARGFHAYWTDRSDSTARKSGRGWEQCWAGWCRRIASRYRQSPSVSRQPYASGSGRGGGIASIAARRRAEGIV